MSGETIDHQDDRAPIYGTAKTRPLTDLVDAALNASRTGPRPPKRRLRLLLELGADDLDELRSALGQIAHDLTSGEMNPPGFVAQSTCGGVGHGWHYELTDDELTTPEQFQARLAAWREARRAASPAAPETEGGQPG